MEDGGSDQGTGGAGHRRGGRGGGGETLIGVECSHVDGGRRRREKNKVERRLDLDPLFLYVKANKSQDGLVLYHSFIV